MHRQFCIGDIVETKKQHPCGGNQWELLRTGADFKMKCLKCQRVVMLDREKFERKVKKTIEK